MTGLCLIVAIYLYCAVDDLVQVTCANAHTSYAMRRRACLRRKAYGMRNGCRELHGSGSPIVIDGPARPVCRIEVGAEWRGSNAYFDISRTGLMSSDVRERALSEPMVFDRPSARPRRIRGVQVERRPT